jgi:hypothetical protein
VSTNDGGHHRPPSGVNFRRKRRSKIGRVHQALTVDLILSEIRRQLNCGLQYIGNRRVLKTLAKN